MYNEYSEKRMEGVGGGLNKNAAREIVSKNRDLYNPEKVSEYLDEEMSLEELEGINGLVNNKAMYFDAMNNKEKYRREQIEELEKLKDRLLGQEYYQGGRKR